MPELAEMQTKKARSLKPLQLDRNTRAEVRRGFGIDPSQLELGESEEVRAMGARAVAKGNVISFAPGEFAPETAEGRRVLGHELEHVRSQAAGEVPMTGDLLEEPGCEAAADRAGAEFAAGSLSAAGPVSPVGAASAPAQGLFGGLKKKLFGPSTKYDVLFELDDYAKQERDAYMQSRSTPEPANLEPDESSDFSEEEVEPEPEPESPAVNPYQGFADNGYTAFRDWAAPTSAMGPPAASPAAKKGSLFKRLWRKIRGK